MEFWFQGSPKGWLLPTTSTNSCWVGEVLGPLPLPFFFTGRYLWDPWSLRGEHYVEEAETGCQSYTDEGRQSWGECEVAPEPIY